MFKYRALDDVKAIRVVVLTKGGYGDAIECRLVHTDRNAVYEALSYEWGLPSDDDPTITLDNCAFKIRKNLWEAFVQLRLPDLDRSLWIDAICIDQANITERNHQVNSMKFTYSDAQRVIVWLGPAANSSDYAMDTLADTRQLRHRIAESTDSQYAGLLAVLNRTYWRRVWIQQELYLAREAIFHCGSRAISESAFFDSFDAIVPYHDNLMRPDPAAFVMMRHRKRDHTRNTLRGWLYLCLEQNLKCTEPRDLIYGMLGMSNDCQQQEIVPDYEKPMKDVFLETIKHCKNATYSSGYSFVDFAKDLARRLSVSVDSQIEDQVALIAR